MPVPEHVPDHSRAERIGFDEAVFCEGKTAEQITAVIETARAQGRGALLTRLSGEQLRRLPAAVRDCVDYDAGSRTGVVGSPAGPARAAMVGVITAGTSDVAVAREAVRTLAYHGERCEEHYDVGVAGLWRLLDRIAELRRMPVLLAVAGMDAALPTVLSGLVPSCVIAVPTSVGYGIAEGGKTALRATLASCAPGLVVVNIDNGYGAACAALRMVRAIRALSGPDDLTVAVRAAEEIAGQS